MDRTELLKNPKFLARETRKKSCWVPKCVGGAGGDPGKERAEEEHPEIHF